MDDTAEKSARDASKEESPDPKRLIPRDPKSLSESEFLTQQAEQAKAAIAKVISDVKAGLGQGVDVKEWTRRYPWIAVGGAAVAGVVAATMAVPSKDEQALKRLARIERALTPPEPVAMPMPNGSGDSGDHAAAAYRSGAGGGFLAGIASQIIAAIKPAVLSALTAGITAKAAKPSHEEMKAAAAAEDQDQSNPAGGPRS